MLKRKNIHQIVLENNIFLSLFICKSCFKGFLINAERFIVCLVIIHILMVLLILYD